MENQIDVREERPGDLTEYVQIPARFDVRSKMDVEVRNGRYFLTEQYIEVPFIKDYDEVENPRAWPLRFDISTWGVLGAFDGDDRVGGAIAAYASPGVKMLEDRQDLAVLWDLRVLPEARQTGVGTALFRAIEDWARARGCRELKVETQDINVAACRFYAHQGCTLTEVNRLAYPDLPYEAQLIWRKPL